MMNWWWVFQAESSFNWCFEKQTATSELTEDKFMIQVIYVQLISSSTLFLFALTIYIHNYNIANGSGFSKKISKCLNITNLCQEILGLAVDKSPCGDECFGNFTFLHVFFTMHQVQGSH